MTRQGLRRVGGWFFIAAILLFGGFLLVASLFGIHYGAHDPAGMYACLVFVVCVGFVGISIACWVVSLFVR